jgi:hypothetical protein
MLFQRLKLCILSSILDVPSKQQGEEPVGKHYSSHSKLDLLTSLSHYLSLGYLP